MMQINSEAYVIIVSAVGYEDVRDNCIEIGAKNYIKKPFNTKDLLHILEEV